MSRQVEQLIQCCAVCQSVNMSAKLVVPPYQPVAFPAGPWEKLGVDVVGTIANVPLKLLMWEFLLVCTYLYLLCKRRSGIFI